MTGLVHPRTEGTIINVVPQGLMTQVHCSFNNQKLTSPMQFCEVGVFAEDPDEGEILYAYVNAGNKGDYIPAFSGEPGAYVIEEDFWLEIYTANVAEIHVTCRTFAYASEIIYDNAVSKLTADNVQMAIDEIVKQFTYYDLGFEIIHKLNCRPHVYVVEIFGGFGMGGYGSIPYGGNGYGIGKYGIDQYGGVGNAIEVCSKAIYPDENSVRIKVNKKYGSVKSVTKINIWEYLIQFEDGIVALYISLLMPGGAYGGTHPSVYGCGVHIGQEPPDDTNKLWLVPNGNLNLTDTVQTVCLSGIYVGDLPPADNSLLWLRPTGAIEN